MTAYENRLNELLVRVFRSIEVLEEEMLRATKTINLTNSEIHMLEAVDKAGTGGVATIGAIAEYLEIRMPSVTPAINKLAARGFVTKCKDPEDGRVVQVRLTREGQRANRAHQYFHRSMVQALVKEMSEEDKGSLMRGISQLDSFLETNIQKYREMP